MFLGVLLDQNFSWKYHINHVKYQTISKARFFLSSKSLLSLYYTLVFLFLIHCKIAWCSTYRSNLNRLLYIYRNASSESFVEQSILPILHLYFGLLISLIFLTSTRSLLLVLCTRITMTSFVKLLTPSLLLIAKYTHIMLEMLITTDHISVEQTLNSSQSSI